MTTVEGYDGRDSTLDSIPDSPLYTCLDCGLECIGTPLHNAASEPTCDSCAMIAVVARASANPVEFYNRMLRHVNRMLQAEMRVFADSLKAVQS